MEQLIHICDICGDETEPLGIDKSGQMREIKKEAFMEAIACAVEGVPYSDLKHICTDCRELARQAAAKKLSEIIKQRS